MNNTVQTLAQTQILADFDDQNPVINTTNIIDAEYTITSEDIPHELSANKELVTINDNNFPTIPTDPTALPKYITLAKKYIEAETKLLNGLKLTPNRYHLALKSTQEHASLLLLAELRLSEILKGIKTCRGMRTDINKKKLIPQFNKLAKSKKEIIKQEFQLSPRQAGDIEKLTPECIKKALHTKMIFMKCLSRKNREDRWEIFIRRSFRSSCGWRYYNCGSPCRTGRRSRYNGRISRSWGEP